MLPHPNAVLKGPFGSLVIVTAGPDSAPLWQFQVFAPHGGAGPAAQLAAAQILRAAARDSAAVQAIRGLYVNRWGHLPGLAPDALVARLHRDLSDGIMFAAFYIPSADFTRFATTQRPDTSTLLADPPGAPVAWSPAQRIAAMLRRVPGHLPDAMRGQVAALFTPQAIALFALLLVGLAIAQFYGAGEVLDAILVGFAWASAGFAGLVALKHFIGAVIDSARETTLPPIEEDAKTAADALVVLGVSFLTAVLLRARDQENIVSTEEPPPPEPLPVKKPPKVEKGWKDFPSKAKPVQKPTAKAPKSLRSKYMGATPSKYSRTGSKVVERMRSEGLIKGDGPLVQGNPNKLSLVGPDGSLTPIGPNVDMAHQTDAVTWWNDTGRFYGPKSPEVRQFMLNPDNYILQPSSINRSAGASLGQTYQPPVPPDFTILEK